jgi:hypothetical protein
MLFLSEKLVRCLNKRAEMVDSNSLAQVCSCHGVVCIKLCDSTNAPTTVNFSLRGKFCNSLTRTSSRIDIVMWVITPYIGRFRFEFPPKHWLYFVRRRAVPRQRSQTNRFLRQQSKRNSGGTVGNAVFYGGPCRGFIRNTTGAKIKQLDGSRHSERTWGRKQRNSHCWKPLPGSV